MEALYREMKMLINNKQTVKKETLLNKLEEIHQKYLNTWESKSLLDDILEDCNQVRDRQHQRIRLLESMLQAVIDKEVI